MTENIDTVTKKPTSSAEKQQAKTHIRLKEYGILLALVFIVLLFNIFTHGTLLQPDNVASLVTQNAYVMILTIGMTMVIIARHIDLSVGSIVGFIGGAIALIMYNGYASWPVACLIALVMGILIGCWQGFWIAYVKIPAFIVTLGGMLLFRGLAIVLVQKTTSGFPDDFIAIGNGAIPQFLGYIADLDVVTLVIGLIAIGGVITTEVKTRMDQRKSSFSESLTSFIVRNILTVAVIGYLTLQLAKSRLGTPIVLILIGLLVITYSFIMNKTKFGRHIYAVGGNLRSAELSGIKTRKVDFLVFVNMGFLSALAAIVTTARAGAAVSNAGTNYELDAIAAAFIGGTAVSGGLGKITGAITGALIMGVLNMGLSILSIGAEWQMAIKGLVVILAVAADKPLSKKGSH